jgi:ABC-type transporter Mla subunit MlaD
MYTLGGIAILGAIVMLAVGYLAPRGIPGRSYYNVKAQFDNADNLTNSYQVRIGGRLVGQVLDPEVKNGKGQVRLQLIQGVKPLLSDTKLRVRPRSAVGVRFVELIPGTKGRPLGENAVIPASQTSEGIQLDEALNTFDADRRRKAQTLLGQLGVGTASRGEDINSALQKGPGFAGDLNQVAAEINRHNGAPARLVLQGGRAANAADPVRDTIASGFRPESEALDVFSSHEGGLRRLLDTAPGSLAAIRSGLVRTSPLLREVRAMSAELTPALRASVPALRNTDALVRGARPGLRALPDTFELAGNAVPPTNQVLRNIMPILPGLEKLFRTPLPLLDTLAARGCDIKLFGDGWTSMMNNQTANGAVLRFQIFVNPESIFGTTEAGKGLNGPIRRNAYPAPCQAGTE